MHQHPALDPIICLACLETREDVGACRRCASGAYVYLSDLIRQALESMLGPHPPEWPQD
jgi:hypothetical protein